MSSRNGDASSGGVLLQSFAEQQILHVPRPQRPAAHRSSSAAATSTSGLAASLHCRNQSFGSFNEVELLEIMLKPADAPAATYLGVSPPVRAGAANPWSHDRSWKLSAYSASSTNLAALRELDSAGESFLSQQAGQRPNKQASGTVRSLVLSGACDGPLPADAAAAPLAGAGAPSDAGCDRTAMHETAPFTCQTSYFLG